MYPAAKNMVSRRPRPVRSSPGGRMWWFAERIDQARSIFVVIIAIPIPLGEADPHSVAGRNGKNITIKQNFRRPRGSVEIQEANRAS